MLTFEQIEKWYMQGLWSAKMVNNAVEKGILTTQERDKIIKEGKIKMARIFIGVGHGGSDPGAVGHVVEKEVCLNVSLELKKILESYGNTVGISRTWDEEGSLEKEINMANAFNPDLAIEVHANAGGGNGFECWIQTNGYGVESRRAARAVESRVEALGQYSRGLKTRKGSSGADYYGWLRRVDCPAILTEGFFVDTKDAYDFDTLAEQKELAKAYAYGILDYFGISIEQSPFDDVSPSDWYYKPVKWAVDRGITAGTSESTFSPDGKITRAQAVQMIYAYYGKRALGEVQKFDDVSKSDWFYNAAHWCRQLKITDGIGDNKFGPDDLCTRAQVVTMLWRGAGSPEVDIDLPFTDVNESDWYYKAVKWAKANGITSGVSADKFGPNETCTRAQMVTFLYNK